MDKYIINEKIGSGKFSIIYKGKQLIDNKEVAIKKLIKKYAK